MVKPDFDMVVRIPVRYVRERNLAHFMQIIADIYELDVEDWQGDIIGELELCLNPSYRIARVGLTRIHGPKQRTFEVTIRYSGEHKVTVVGPNTEEEAVQEAENLAIDEDHPGVKREVTAVREIKI